VPQDAFLEGTTTGKWIIFHDESYCDEKGFLYHGFLFVRTDMLKELKEKLLNSKAAICSKTIHFNELRGLNSGKSLKTLEWLEMVKKWLPADSIKFYTLGIDLKKLNYDIWGNDRNRKIYRRFYEIGLKAAIKWFGMNEEDVTFLFFDQGKQDQDRYYKSKDICGINTKVSPLYSSCSLSGRCLSKFLQLTDVLLGTARKSFTSVSKNKKAQRMCVESLREIVEHFTKKEAYNPNHECYKKYCISFFPKNIISVEDFLNQDLKYHLNMKDAFYNVRETHIQKEGREKQEELFRVW